MNLFRLIVSIGLFLSMLYFLKSPLSVGENTLPPPGYFLDPQNGFLQNRDVDIEDFLHEFDIPGLNNKVTIHYDSMGVPHIFTQSNHDLFLTQGYLVAKERLWQMEFQIMAASGRVSEIIGKKALNFDREQRRKDLKTGAIASLEELKKNEALYENLESYSEGVNAYIQSLEYKNLPVEYKLLNYEPEEWTPLKSSLLITYMVDMLCGSDRDIRNTNALAILGRDTFDLLFPERTPGTVPVVPTTSPWDFDPLQTEPDTIPYSIYDLDLIKQSNPDNGSNNWAVSGDRTKNGVPILANDTHLGLNLPSLWIPMQLHSNDMNTAGFALVGGPGIVIGFNENIAWGFTNAARDQRDWYRITYNENNPGEYLYKGSYKTIEYRYDTIKIKGESPFIDTVKITEIGPVVYDQSFPGKGNKKELALEWIGHYPSKLYEALYTFNTAKNYAEFKKGLKFWDAPSQNIVFASTNGDIAMHIEGTFPLKWEEQGKFIMDASREKHLWNEFIPHEQNIYMHNPERGFVSSANQHSTDSLYPYYVYNGNYESYRNKRINTLLERNDSVTPEDFMKMHNDSYSILASEVMPFMYDSLEIQGFDSTHFGFYHKIGEWNFRYTPDSYYPSFFEAWWSHFKNLLWDELNEQEVRLPIPNDFHTVYLIKNNKDFPFIDIQETEHKEKLRTVITQAYSEAVSTMKDWKDTYGNYQWKTVNGVRIEHLTKIPAFNSSVLAVAGSGDAINAFNHSHGPSQRLIVELSKQPKAWIALPGGTSGNPGSRRYLEFAQKYADGQYFELPLLTESELTSKGSITIEKK